jgi:hypothetical protein
MRQIGKQHALKRRNEETQRKGLVAEVSLGYLKALDKLRGAEVRPYGARVALLTTRRVKRTLL